MEKYKIKSFIRLAAHESKAISEKVKWMPLPENVESWISDAIDFANNLPDTLDQKHFILRYASFARNSINNEQKLKEHMFHILNNIENAKHDEALLKRKEHLKKISEAPKHKKWADDVAQWLLKKHRGLTESQVWAQIPDSAFAEEIEGDDGDFIFYKSGDDLVKTQNGIEKKLKKSTFFKEYYRKAKLSGK